MSWPSPSAWVTPTRLSRLRVYGHLFAGVQEDLTRRLDDLRHAGHAPAGGDVVQINQGRRSRAGSSVS